MENDSRTALSTSCMVGMGLCWPQLGTLWVGGGKTSRNLTVSSKYLEMTFVLIWRYINKTEINWIELEYCVFQSLALSFQPETSLVSFIPKQKYLTALWLVCVTSNKLQMCWKGLQGKQSLYPCSPALHITAVQCLTDTRLIDCSQHDRGLFTWFPVPFKPVHVKFFSTTNYAFKIWNLISSI